MSAPYCSITFSGSTVLPSDLDIFLPSDVHREAVCQHRVVRRPPARAAAFQQRRLEPAAMLVRAFEIEIRRPAQLGPFAAFEHESVGAARIEPHVENVGDHLERVGIVPAAEQCVAASSAFHASTPLSRTAAMMRSLTASSTRYCPVSLLTNSVIGTPQARWRLITQSGRPSTIAVMRFSPFGGTKRVAAMAASAFSRSVARVVLVPSVLIDRDEPLRRRAENQLGLGPPRMRIAVLVIGTRREQRAASRKSAQIGPSGALNLGLMTDPCPPSQPQSRDTCHRPRPRTPARSRCALHRSKSSSP